MERRHFLACIAGVVLVPKYDTVSRKPAFYRFYDGPVGLMDITNTRSLHGLNGSLNPQFQMFRAFS